MKSRRTSKPARPLFDKRTQIKSDPFNNKNNDVINYISIGLISMLFHRFTGIFSGMFNWFARDSAISSLDLRSDSPRGHGAAYLRSVWPNLQPNNMVSTRDGKSV